MFCTAAPEPASLPLPWLLLQGIGGVARAKASGRLAATSVAVASATRLPASGDPWPMPPSLSALPLPARQWLLLACHAALEAHGHPAAAAAATAAPAPPASSSSRGAGFASGGNKGAPGSDGLAAALAAPVPAAVVLALAAGAACSALAAAEAVVWLARLEPRAGSPFVGTARYMYLSDAPNHNADASSGSGGGGGSHSGGGGGGGGGAPWGSGSAAAPRFVKGTPMGDKAAAAHLAAQALANPDADLPTLVRPLRLVSS
jgi:hypothetical protein